MGLPFALLGAVIGTVGTAIGKFLSNKPTISMPENPYIKEEATIDQTSVIIGILSKLKSDYKRELYELETEVTESYENMYKENLRLIKEKIKNNNIDININTDDIENKYNKAIREFMSNFSREILDELEINNTKCQYIFKIPNKEEKERKMKDYLDNLTKNALDQFCIQMDKIAKDILNNIESNVNKSISNYKASLNSIQKDLEENMKLKEDEIEIKRKEYERKEKIIKDLIINK